MSSRSKKRRQILKTGSSKRFNLEENADSTIGNRHGNKNGFVIGEADVSFTRQDVQWRKILYEKQPFPDNYCSPKFLNELQTNVTAKTYSFDEAVRGSLILMHQVNSVVLYVISFAFIRSGFLHWHVLLITCVVMALAGYCIYAALVTFRKWNESVDNLPFSIRQTVKTLALYVGFGYGLSPVFKTLTETISTDTIYALATFMFVMNIAFADYGVDVAVVSSALSLNAGIFGAVCLISRLSSSNEVFSLLTAAVEMFVLWPLLRWQILALNSKISVCLAVISAGIVIAVLRVLSGPATVAYIILHLFVALACPWGLLKMQPLKSTIHGPWDEAIVLT